MFWPPDTSHSPLQKVMRRIGLSMMLEPAFNLRSDHDFLHRIAQQIAHHAHAIGMRQLDKHGKLGTMVRERCVGRMPDTFPTEDAAPWSIRDRRRDSGDTAIPARIATSDSDCSAAQEAYYGATRSSKGTTNHPAQPQESAGPSEDRQSLGCCS